MTWLRKPTPKMVYRSTLTEKTYDTQDDCIRADAHLALQEHLAVHPQADQWLSLIAELDSSLELRKALGAYLWSHQEVRLSVRPLFTD